MKKRSHSNKSKTRLREKHRTARIVRFCLFAVFFLSIVLGLAVVSRSPWAKLRSVTIVGNNLVSAEELKNLTEQETATALLGIFKTDNIILYPKKRVEKKITENFKSIQKVEISFKTPNELALNVIEREPRFLWCPGRESAPQDCFYMDVTGFVFSKSPAFSGNIFFIYYGLLQSGSNPEGVIGKTFLSNDRLKSLAGFAESVKTLGANPTALLAHSEDDYELFLSPHGRILFNDKADFLKTFENFEAIVKSRDGVMGKGNFLANLDYIDLRFGFKAFFKLR